MSVSQQHVGLVEGLAEVVPQRLGAREAVRLEEHDRAPLARAAAERLEGHADLGRVVAVVVDHQDALRLAAHLEAPVDAGEGLEAGADRVEGHVEVEAHRHRGERVRDVVGAGHGQGHPAERPAVEGGGVARAGRRELEVAGGDARLGGEAVGHHPPLDPRQDVLHRGVVEAQHRAAVEGDLVHEAEEGLLDVGEVAVGVEVLAVDVRDDGHGGGELQERAVGLVRLRHQELALAEPRAGAEDAEPPAHDHRRVEPAAVEHERHHRGGRGLAVAARDRHPVLEAHELGQHLRPRDDGHAVPAGLGHLGVLPPHRGRDDHHVRPARVLRRVAAIDARAQATRASRSPARRLRSEPDTV